MVKTKKAGLLTKLVVLALLIYLSITMLDLQGQIAAAQSEQDDLNRQVAKQIQRNAELADAVENTALFRRETDGFSLAFPWAPKAPFPLVPAFCFARVETMEGRPWVVFSFRDGGWPVVPPSCQNGESGVQ